MPDARVLVPLLASAFAASVAGAQALSTTPSSLPTIVGSVRTTYDPGALVFPGNALPCATDGCRLQAMTVADGERFRVAIARVGLDGRVAPVFVDAGQRSDFDPVLQRLSDGAVLLAYHGDGALHFRVSADDGIRWSDLGRLVPPEGVAYSEAFLRSVGKSGLALVYARWDAASRRTTIELRSSSDGGRSWTDALRVGSSGAVSDGTRAALSHVDEQGRAWVSYSARAKIGDPASIYVQQVESRPWALVGNPRVVARVAVHPGNVGVFPVVLTCPSGPEVVFTAVGADGRGRIYFARPEAPRAPRVLLVRNRAANGFGRLWFGTTASSDRLDAILARSPDRSRASIEVVTIAPPRGCVP